MRNVPSVPILAALLCAALLPACTTAPTSKEVQLLRLAREADATYQAGDLNRAKDQYEALLEKNPNYATAHVRLGAIAYRQGDEDLARREFKTALQRDPKNSQAKYNLAMLSLNEALELLKEYLEIASPDQERSAAHSFLAALEEFARTRAGR